LLISPDYLASDWIVKEELPYILEKQRERGLRIFPIILRPSLWKNTPLAYYQLWPYDGRALTSFKGAERDHILVELVDQIYAALRKEEDLLVTNVHAGRDVYIVDSAGAVGPSVGTDKSEEQGRFSQPCFFISHSKDDGDFAENLKFKIEKEGYHGWIDVDILDAGVDWRKEIDEAILNSEGVILVLSPSSKNSEYVTYEWAFALGSGIKIVPLMLKETPIHPRLEVFQYLDFTNRRARPWNRLLGLLRETVQQNGLTKAST
jgi:hypothetical protein